MSPFAGCDWATKNATLQGLFSFFLIGFSVGKPKTPPDMGHFALLPVATACSRA